jgi:hypothetical protein
VLAKAFLIASGSLESARSIASAIYFPRSYPRALNAFGSTLYLALNASMNSFTNGSSSKDE